MGVLYGIVAIVFALTALAMGADGEPLGTLAMGAVALIVAYATFRRDQQGDGPIPRYMAVFAFALTGLAFVLMVRGG